MVIIDQFEGFHGMHISFLDADGDKLWAYRLAESHPGT